MSQRSFSPGGFASGVVITSSNTKTWICDVEVPTGSHATLTMIVDGRIMSSGAGAGIQRMASVSNPTGTPVVDAVLTLLGGVLAPLLSPLLGAVATLEPNGAGKVGLYIQAGTTQQVEWAGMVFGVIN